MVCARPPCAHRHDIFIKRIGFSLIRVFRMHTQTCNSANTDEKLLSQLKWPIEYMFVGLQPSWNNSENNPKRHRDWHRYARVFDDQVDDFNVAEGVSAAPPGAAAGTSSAIGQVVPNTWAVETAVVESVSLTAHGISIIDNTPETFFNSYNPFHYGGTNIVVPDDRGCLMINFALFPGSYQPSGHLNISRAREFYLSWTTLYITPTNPADLVVIGIAINFLLVTDGSAILRYTT